MYEVDRLVTVLKPTQAFLDWLKQLPDQEQDLSLEDLSDDCTALLLPAFESPDEADDYIEAHAEEILANECECWCEDESRWPGELTFEKLTEWFDIEHHSMVFDMTESDEEYDDEYEDDEEDDDSFDDEDYEEDFEDDAGEDQHQVH